MSDTIEQPGTTQPQAAPAETTQTAQQPAAQPTGKTFTQAELDAIIKERLTRAEEATKRETEKAARKAEEEAAAKNGEWQKLAESRQAEIDNTAKRLAELEPYQTQAQRYKDALEKHLSGMTEKLPEHVKELLKGKDPVEQIEYLTKFGPALGVKNGVPPTPPDNQTSVPQSEVERRRAEYARQVRQNKP